MQIHSKSNFYRTAIFGHTEHLFYEDGKKIMMKNILQWANVMQKTSCFGFAES